MNLSIASFCSRYGRRLYIARVNVRRYISGEHEHGRPRFGVLGAPRPFAFDRVVSDLGRVAEAVERRRPSLYRSPIGPRYREKHGARSGSIVFLHDMLALARMIEWRWVRRRVVGMSRLDCGAQRQVGRRLRFVICHPVMAWLLCYADLARCRWNRAVIERIGRKDGLFGIAGIGRNRYQRVRTPLGLP